MSNVYLLDDFKTWIAPLFTRPSNYITWLNGINSKFIDSLSTGKNGVPPMDVLEKLMTSKSGPKLMAVEDLLVSIQSAITKELKIRRANTTNYATFENEQSAFNKYVAFILSKVKSGPYRKTDLTQSETTVCKHITGEQIILGRADLVTIFASRLSTQDRITGAKTYLPLGLLSKVGCNVREWAKKEANDVIIHLDNSTVKVKDINDLIIDTITSQVTVTLPDGNIQMVYNPPLNGVKTPMKVSAISDTDIDHDPEIHTVLTRLQGKLPGLDSVTVAIKNSQKKLGYVTINSKNCDAIYKDVISSKIITPNVIQTIDAELDFISKQHDLQLTTKDWNRSTKKIAKRKTIKTKP